MTRLLPALLATLTLSAQTARLTEQLGRTEMYVDVAISPDGARLAWIETPASAYEPRVAIAPSGGGVKPVHVSLGTDEGRRDSDPAWSTDSRTLAFFSTAGAQDQQQQLWTVAADGRRARRRTDLQGYAARPQWSHDGSRIAFLYIEGAGGGGPLFAAPALTGVIDTQIHNQRIAVLEVSTGKVRSVSPPDLHVYDFDWSPDDRSFVATAAPGPGDNNWWIAQIHTFDSSTGEGRSIYKPALQVAVPRWSPDGSAISFIEGLMSDEGFHGGDLFTIPAAGGHAVNRTEGRKASPSSAMWTAPGRLLVTEYQGGGSAISELDLAGSGMRMLWQGPDGVHSAGNFPNFAASRDGSVTAMVRSDFTHAPEVWAGPVNAWKQITSANDAQTVSWGKAESVQWTNDNFTIQGWLLPPKQVDPGRKYPLIVIIHGGPSGSETAQLAVDAVARSDTGGARLLRAHAESARQLRGGRGVHSRQREGLRRRGSARHHGRRGLCDRALSD